MSLCGRTFSRKRLGVDAAQPVTVTSATARMKNAGSRQVMVHGWTTCRCGRRYSHSRMNKGGNTPTKGQQYENFFFLQKHF